LTSSRQEVILEARNRMRMDFAPNEISVLAAVFFQPLPPIVHTLPA
jgi:hypothetical protein